MPSKYASPIIRFVIQPGSESCSLIAGSAQLFVISKFAGQFTMTRELLDAKLTGPVPKQVFEAPIKVYTGDRSTLRFRPAVPMDLVR